MMLKFIYAIAFCSFFLGSPAFAELDEDNTLSSKQFTPRFVRPDVHRWERYVRGFRREHHFALMSGITSGRWQIKRLGQITAEQDFDASGVYGRFQYSFHLPLWGGFGYFLGSSFGYHYESADKRQTFRPVDAIGFPGVLAGFILNINPALRIGAGIDASLERFNGLSERPRDCLGQEDCKPTKIYVTMQSYYLSGFIDVFYDLDWAIRLEMAQRELRYSRPESASGFPVDANLRKADRWLGLGFVRHLL